MRTWIWKIALAVSLVGLIGWQQVTVCQMEEKYRILCDRQDAVEQMTELLPEMIEIALERHRRIVIAYMESDRDD